MSTSSGSSSNGGPPQLNLTIAGQRTGHPDSLARRAGARGSPSSAAGTNAQYRQRTPRSSHPLGQLAREDDRSIGGYIMRVNRLGHGEFYVTAGTPQVATSHNIGSVEATVPDLRYQEQGLELHQHQQQLWEQHLRELQLYQHTPRQFQQASQATGTNTWSQTGAMTPASNAPPVDNPVETQLPATSPWAEGIHWNGLGVARASRPATPSSLRSYDSAVAMSDDIALSGGDDWANTALQHGRGVPMHGGRVDEFFDDEEEDEDDDLIRDIHDEYARNH